MPPSPPLSFHSEAPPLSLPLHCLPLTNKPARHGVFNTNKTQPRSSKTGIITVRAVKEESQQFEVDPEKAREALKNLDQQFQSRTQKQVRIRPKKQPTAPPSLNFTRSQTRASAEELSGDFFTYTAIALLGFTIFYNVLFYTVIKPSVDGFSEDAPASSVAGEIRK